MGLTEEYQKQAMWRAWEDALLHLPIQPHETVIDLGCGVGTLTARLAADCHHVIGIDNDPDLLQTARANCAPNSKFLCADLSHVDRLQLESVDGLWSSFVCAYFPNVRPILRQWLTLLNEGGWIALIEIDQLFLGHRPLSAQTVSRLRAFGAHQAQQNIYDVNMGAKLAHHAIECQLNMVYQGTLYDPELTASGALEPHVVTAWERRFERMTSLQNYLGHAAYHQVKAEFLAVLASPQHQCDATVNYYIGRKSTMPQKSVSESSE